MAQLKVGDNLTVFCVDADDGSCIVVDDQGVKWELCYDECARPQVMAYCEGGCIQGARANVPLDFTILDRDDLLAEGRDDDLERMEDEYESLEFGVC